jgi:hypothetical protein
VAAVALVWPTVAVSAGTGAAAAMGVMAVGGAAGLCATADVQAVPPATTAIAVTMANLLRNTPRSAIPNRFVVVISTLSFCLLQPETIRDPAPGWQGRQSPRVVGCCSVSLHLAQLGFAVGNLVFAHLFPQHLAADA